FSFLKGSTISLDTSKKNASCMTCVHLELNRTHQSILFCSTQFKNARHIERCGKNALEIIQEFPSLTPIVIGGDFSVYKQMNDDLLNIKYKTLPQEPISFFKELVHSTSSQYRPKDCLYVSREITLKEMKPITSMYMGSFPSHSTPMMAVISIPLKEM
ncbi:MAG: hypothetical protein IKE51_05890, partial [Solobacterium sp.]|nr:hypothetical protein [Solobacterium sp.]